MLRIPNISLYTHFAILTQANLSNQINRREAKIQAIQIELTFIFIDALGTGSQVRCV